MANISDAAGTIVLGSKSNADWTDNDKLNLIYMLSTLSIGDYGIIINDFEQTYNNLKNNSSLDFIGSGRWSFQNVLKVMYDWAKICKKHWDHVNEHIPVKYQITHEEYLLRLDNLIKRMYANDLIITWKFIDYESGFQLFYSEEGFHYVTSDLDLKYVTLNSEDIKPTAKNVSDYLYDGSIEPLDYYIETIMKLYGLKQTRESYDTILSLITKHPTWFSIIAYDVINDKDDIPTQLRMQLDTIFKEGAR